MPLPEDLQNLIWRYYFTIAVLPDMARFNKQSLAVHNPIVKRHAKQRRPLWGLWQLMRPSSMEIAELEEAEAKKIAAIPFEKQVAKQLVQAQRVQTRSRQSLKKQQTAKWVVRSHAKSQRRGK